MGICSSVSRAALRLARSAAARSSFYLADRSSVKRSRSGGFKPADELATKGPPCFWAAPELPMKRSISLTACVLVLVVGIIVAVERLANAQGQPSPSVAEEERLEQDFTDPLTTLPQLIIRDSYTPANYGPCTRLACTRDYETNQLIVRPLIPRVPPRSFLPFNQLIRPTLALVTVPSSRGGTRTEFGDLSLFDVAVLPWPDRKNTGLLIGIGPTLVFPTATSRSAGQGAWQAGPA